ncbi:MAG: molybdate ABC transporter substrate-binding protein [Magnetococcus sp. YQC-5]
MKVFVYAWLLLWPGLLWAETIHVAVTSSFKKNLEQLAPLFTRQTGHQLLISSGSSGKLYAQIQNGAPYHLFLAADETYPALLLQADLALPESRFVYAIGRLVLFAAHSKGLPEGVEAVTSGAIKRIALANPNSAPYGRAAREVLTALDLWQGFARRVAVGENVGHVLAFVHSGAVDAGFVAYAQLLDEQHNLSSGWLWEPPSDLYTPLRQEGIVLRRGAGRADVGELITFLTSARIRTLLVQMGYGKPP